MKKVTWGVLSTAKIGMEKVTPALMRSQWCDVQADRKSTRLNSSHT